MVFEPTISLGNILTLIGVIGAFVAFSYRVLRRFDAIEIKVELMWQTYQIVRREEHADND